MAKDTLGHLVVRLFLDQAEYKAGIKDAEQTTKSFSSTVSSMGDRLGGHLVNGLKAATAAMTAFGAASTVVGSKFEHQMQALAAVRGGVSRLSLDYTALEEKARDLGATTMFTATQAAEGMEQLARAASSRRPCASLAWMRVRPSTSRTCSRRRRGTPSSTSRACPRQ